MGFLNLNITGDQETQFRTKWEEKWRCGFEQEVSKLKPFVTVKSVTGNKVKSSDVSSLYVHEYSGYRQKMEVSDISFGNRIGTKRKFAELVPISVDEQMDMARANDYVGVIETQMRKAAGPFTDMVILGLEHITAAAPTRSILPDYANAATITGYRLPTSGRKGGILGVGTKENADGDEVDATLDYGRTLVDGVDTIGRNLVPIDYSTSGTGVSANLAGTFIDKCNYVIRKLQEMHALPAERDGVNNLVIAVNPAVQQLLRSYELGLNRDYGMSVLGDGSFNKFLKATVMMSTMLPTITTKRKKVGTASTELENVDAVACCAWLKDQVELLMWRDTQFKIVDLSAKYKDVDQGVKVRGVLGCQRLNDQTVFVMPMAV